MKVDKMIEIFKGLIKPFYNFYTEIVYISTHYITQMNKLYVK